MVTTPCETCGTEVLVSHDPAAKVDPATSYQCVKCGLAARLNQKG